MKKVVVYFSLVAVLLCGLFYYIAFPAINIHTKEFWMALIVVCVMLGIFSMSHRNWKELLKHDRVQMTKTSKVFFVLTCVLIGVLILGELAGSKLFFSKKYASILKVEEGDFTNDIVQSDRVTDIALMDSESARVFGERKVGSLSDVVSQYEVSKDYSQINIKGEPMKVASLNYASFFKWLNNRKTGIPGYVEVNPVNSDAKYVKLSQGMKYVPSGMFNDNLQRHVQFQYPTKIIGGYYFEVDDAGNPYYVCPTMSPKVGLFGAMDVDGVILCNPVNGKSTYYKVTDVPKWVDRVYDGHLLEKKYNWKGTLSGGYINSLIGQKGCRRTTDDFGYKTIGDDVWVYTGVTSVTGDQSNIGFVMMNQRTSEAKFYKVSGAEEHSAMSAAEGEVQEKGYKAAFPSLINVGGAPTYIMILKDNGGLVKMYAMVNVEQYNIVSTATTQSEVFSKYKKLLEHSDSRGQIKVDAQKATITVQEVRFVDTDDGTMVYIKDESHQVYKQAFSDNEQLIKISVGNRLSVEYDASDNGINDLQKFQILEQSSELSNQGQKRNGESSGENQKGKSVESSD